ncbi:hypothetical protein YC2023_098380 [Brassica napus]
MNLDRSRTVILTSLLHFPLVSCRVILQVNISSLVGLDVTFQTTIEAGQNLFKREGMLWSRNPWFNQSLT